MKLSSLLFAKRPDTKGEKRAPFIYVPTLYFAEGLPYVVVNTVSVIMYSAPEFEIPNSQMAFFTSLLMFPWILKMLWGPVVDKYSTKRTWLLLMQLACTLLFALLSWSAGADAFFAMTLTVFAILAFISATHDIAIDGFYMLSMTMKQQAFFVGFRSLFYRIAMMFEGVLVSFVGIVEIDYGFKLGWISAFALCALLFTVLTIFHYRYLPYPASDLHISTDISFFRHYIAVIKQFFTQKKVMPVLAFILLYRFGEGMLTKMVPPFLLGSPETGALGISTLDFGIIKSSIGTASLIAGGIIGGWLIARYGLRKCIWPMALALNLPDLLYVYLAYAKPALPHVSVAVAAEHFGYGIGFSAFMMFLITVSKGKNKTSLYAIATGIMALGLMIPGMVSGFIQEWLGYQNFFVCTALLTIPGMITIFFIPLEENIEQL